MSKDTSACNFCGKLQSDVPTLVAGPNVYICNECVDLANEICKEAKNKKDKDDPIKRKATLLLKRLLVKNATIYTISTFSAGARVLIARQNKIHEISGAICDLFGAVQVDTCKVEDLSEVLFGSRHALRRRRL